jgi:hypothetical protein
LLLFDRTVYIRDAQELEGLPNILEGEEIVDIQVVESMAKATLLGLQRTLGLDMPPAWVRRLDVADKVIVAKMLREAGLFVPPTMVGSTLKASEIIDELGLPVVHKPRCGSSGTGVSVLDTQASLERLLGEGGHSEEHFFERFIQGSNERYAGVAGDRSEQRLTVTYEPSVRMNALGPAVSVCLIEDPVLDNAGETIVDVLGMTGFFSVQVIKDGHGRHWVHDVNARVPGTFLCHRRAGIDLLGAYVGWIQGRWPQVVPGRPPLGVPLPMFPEAYQLKYSDEQKAHAGISDLWRFVRAGAHFAMSVSARYVIYEVIRQTRSRLTVSNRFPQPQQSTETRS